MFNLLDSFAAGVCLIFIVIFELLVVGWAFGRYIASVSTIKYQTCRQSEFARVHTRNQGGQWSIVLFYSNGGV